MKTNISCVRVEPESESMKNAFILWFNNTVADSDCPELDEHEVYIVWFCHIVGNAKMLISTNRPDHMYYEVTYHEDKKQLHIDAYKKFSHESLNICKNEKVEDTEEDGEDPCETIEDMFNRSIASVFNNVF